VSISCSEHLRLYFAEKTNRLTITQDAYGSDREALERYMNDKWDISTLCFEAHYLLHSGAMTFPSARHEGRCSNKRESTSKSRVFSHSYGMHD
jgi:hypothetical protein